MYSITSIATFYHTYALNSAYIILTSTQSNSEPGYQHQHSQHGYDA